VNVLDLGPSQRGVAVRPEGSPRESGPRTPSGTTSKVRLVELQAGPTAVVRATMRPDAVTGWLGGAYRRLAAALNQQKVSRTGPAFARYTFHGDLVEVEAGFPVCRAIVGDTTAAASGLPGGTVAVATHGGTGSLGAVYNDIEAWLDEHGFVAAGPHWEVYPAGPHLVSNVGPTQVVVPCRRWDSDRAHPRRAERPQRDRRRGVLAATGHAPP
jgi:effector-binding domain-containing protein